MSLKGRQSIGKMENNVDTLREHYLFATVSQTGSGKVALDTVQKKFTQVIAGQVVESGSTDNVLAKTAHGLKVGYMLRIITTANGILEEEVTVDTVIDANTVKLSAFLSASLAAGDTYDVYKPVSERVAADGSSLATVLSPPIQIIKNGVVETVEDSLTAADVVAIPVKLVASDGTNITINAGAIDVQNSAEGVNFDSIRIGDGTAKYASITSNLEMSTHDADALVELTSIESSASSIDTKTPALGQALKAASVPVTLASDQEPIVTRSTGTLSTVNSTSVNLAPGATFTGVGEEVLNVGDISIGIVASHNSAVGGLKFEFSPDNSSWYESDAYSYVTLNGIAVYSLAPVMRYFRVRYINGATLTTTLHIQTTYRAYYTKASSHRLEDFVNADNDAELVKAVLAAKKPDDTWTNIECTTGGNLKVSVEEFDTSLPTGTNTIGAVNQGAAGVSSWLTSVTSSALPTGAATEANQTSDIAQNLSLLGSLTETAPVNDTASSGLNGRLQRIAQRLTSLIALFPTALGQGTMAQSLKVVLPSDQVVNTAVAANSTGSQAKSTLASGSATLTAPANATGFFLKNAGDSTGDLCWEIGGTATAASFDLTGGQGTAFVPCSANVSIFAKDGSVNYAIQWMIK